jgi:hypothetical protein
MPVTSNPVSVALSASAVGSRQDDTMVDSSRSVHDNNVYGHVVINASNHRSRYTVILFTESQHRAPPEYTNVIFRNTIAHGFENIKAGNILFGITETTIDELYTTYEHTFTAMKEEAWPLPFSRKQDFVLTVQAAKARAYIIESSYGLRGWILAEQMEIRPVRERVVVGCRMIWYHSPASDTRRA